MFRRKGENMSLATVGSVMGDYFSGHEDSVAARALPY